MANETKYNLFYRNTEQDELKPFKDGLTEEQLDIFWASLKFWERPHIVIEKVKEEDEREM